MSTLVSLFGCTVNCPLYSSVKFGQINKLATQAGYLVTPDAANKDTYEYLVVNTFNPNKTLYASWNDVVSKSRLELFMDQLVHYASTYGTDFTDEPFVFNDGDYFVEFNDFKIIDAVSTDKMFELCVNMLSSGAALKSEEVDIIMTYVKWYIKTYSYDPNKVYDVIKNNEAKIIFSDTYNIYPKNGVDLFKYLVYKATNETMVVINDELYNRIVCSRFDLSNFSDDDLRILSECFNRFKYLFLAFKNANAKNRKVINKIRRYAKKYHKPMKAIPSMNIINSFYNDFDNLDKELKKTTNFRLVSLLNYLYSVKNSSDNSFYIIRNGKCYVKTSTEKKDLNVNSIIDYVRGILVDNLKKKAGVVKYNEYVNLACPTSTKNFIGEFPFGSSIKMDKNNYVGIYWENSWGTYDFDLSFIDIKTRVKIGWNSDYYSTTHDVVYSGDMTSAPHGASEVIRIDEFDGEALVMVNRYYGDTNSKFMIFGGSSKSFDKKTKYMVDPNTIRFKDMCLSTNKESIVGFVTNNRLYFMSFPYSNTRISSIYNDNLNDALSAKVLNYLNLKDILNDAGFIEYDSNIHETCDYDFNEINKNTLIELFS